MFRKEIKIVVNANTGLKMMYKNNNKNINCINFINAFRLEAITKKEVLVF